MRNLPFAKSSITEKLLHEAVRSLSLCPWEQRIASQEDGVY